MFQKQVILDRESFKALSSEKRVEIINNLTERRMTLTELSKKLNLGASTIKSHCSILMNSGLIIMVDEGRKWKYYELTKKGEQLSKPSLLEEAKVLVMLSISVVAIIGILFLILQTKVPFLPELSSGDSISIINENKDFQVSMNMPSERDMLINKGTDSENNESIGSYTEKTKIHVNLAVQLIAISMVAGIMLGWFVRKKSSTL